jgi:hypothetical protein
MFWSTWKAIIIQSFNFQKRAASPWALYASAPSDFAPHYLFKEARQQIALENREKLDLPYLQANMFVHHTFGHAGNIKKVS